MPSDLAVRYASTKDDCAAIFKLYAETTFQSLAGFALMNPVKVVAAIITTVDRGAAVIFEHEGECVASVGLMRQTWWHADDGVLVDEWCSVAPRFQTPADLLFMVRELRAFSMVAGLPILIGVHTGRHTRRMLWIDGRAREPGNG